MTLTFVLHIFANLAHLSLSGFHPDFCDICYFLPAWLPNQVVCMVFYFLIGRYGLILLRTLFVTMPGIILSSFPAIISTGHATFLSSTADTFLLSRYQKPCGRSGCKKHECLSQILCREHLCKQSSHGMSHDYWFLAEFPDLFFKVLNVIKKTGLPKRSVWLRMGRPIMKAQSWPYARISNCLKIFLENNPRLWGFLTYRESSRSSLSLLSSSTYAFAGPQPS